MFEIRYFHSNIGVLYNSPVMKLTGGLVEKPPKPIKYSLANCNQGFHTPNHTVAISTGRSHFEPSIASVTNSQQSASTTKTFLNNSLQAVQQKMEDLLPTGQTTSSLTKELPLLSRISNEISANTANTVKVLKRRLSLN